jgi:hypothetical protein
MPIDGERFQRRSPFLFIGLFNHDAHHAPWFFLFYNIKKSRRTAAWLCGGFVRRLEIA